MRIILFLFLFISCAHQGITETDFAEADRQELMVMWERSLKNNTNDSVNARLGEHTLDHIYLSSLDSEDFFQHFMKLNLASQLKSKEAHDQLSYKLLKLKSRLDREKMNTKSNHISVLLSELAQKVQESSDLKFGK